jgi:hypothetical protein
MHGRFSEEELRKIGPYQKSILGLDSAEYASEIQEAKVPDLQNTGKEGLGGPSKVGVYTMESRSLLFHWEVVIILSHLFRIGTYLK